MTEVLGGVVMISSKSVLFVGDNDVGVMLVGCYLANHVPDAYRLIVSGSLEEAKGVLREIRPDIVILDLGLVGLTGSIGVLGLLDVLPSTERLPPIVVLNDAYEPEVVCEVIGTTGFCTKRKMVDAPHDFVQLLQACLTRWEQQQVLIKTTGSPHAPCANFLPIDSSSHRDT